MTHEDEQIPIAPSEQFITFIESHADIVLEPADRFEADVIRESIWLISAPSQLVPIDTVHFKIMIDLGPDKTIFHEMKFTFNEHTVLWIGYDTGNSVFSAAIGDAETQIGPEQIANILNELMSYELTGNFYKQSAED